MGHFCSKSVSVYIFTDSKSDAYQYPKFYILHVFHKKQPNTSYQSTSMFNQCLLNEQKLKVNLILIILISSISSKDVEWYNCVKLIESK